MIFAIRPRKFLHIEFKDFLKILKDQITRDGYVELVDINRNKNTVYFESRNQRIFSSSLTKFGLRDAVCIGLIPQYANKENVQKCMIHDPDDAGCGFFEEIHKSTIHEISLDNERDVDPYEIIDPLNGKSAFFLTDEHLSKYTAIERYLPKSDPRIPIFQQLIRSIFPILSEVRVDDKVTGYQIKGTGFYFSYKDEKYFVTAKHVLVEKENDEFYNYVLGFEGELLNEYYLIKRKDLKKDGLTWSWIDYESEAPWKIDIIVSKIDISDDLQSKLGIQPYKATKDDFQISPGDNLVTFGFPHGYGEDLKRLLEASLNKELNISPGAFTSLFPKILSGIFLSMEDVKTGFTLTSNLAAADGISGSPLFLLEEEGPKFLGINIKTTKERIEKTTFSRDSTMKETYRYTNKVKTVHFGHLLQIIEAPHIKNRAPHEIREELIETRYRDLSFIKKDNFARGG